MLRWVGILSVVGLVLLVPAGASAGTPIPFATASAPCSSGEIVFPIQATAHPNVIASFKSIGAEGQISGNELGLNFKGFAAGDSGWMGTGSESNAHVEAGTAPVLGLACNGGSVEASLAERPTTPATFSGETSPPAFSNHSEIPFTAPGSGQYVVTVTILQGGIEVQGVSGIIQSSGEYPVGHLEAGNHGLSVQPAPGPKAIWSATVTEAPVAINKLAFAQACMAPGRGIPANFSVTGDTTITASVTNSTGQAVRELGTFPMKEGSSSIAWDGRATGGAAVPSGTYNLNLRSADPQGDQTTAQTSVVVATGGPTIAMTTPTTLLTNQSVGFQVTDTGGCGTASAQIVITEPGGETFQESFGEGLPLPANGAISVSPGTAWAAGAYKWSAKTLDKAGNSRTTTGSFKIVEALPPTRCLIPQLAGKKVAVSRKLLVKAGCRVGKVVRKPSGKVQVGRVIRSTPHAGARRPLHAKVNLVVARHLPARPHKRRR